MKLRNYNILWCFGVNEQFLGVITFCCIIFGPQQEAKGYAGAESLVHKFTSQRVAYAFNNSDAGDCATGEVAVFDVHGVQVA